MVTSRLVARCGCGGVRTPVGGTSRRGLASISTTSLSNIFGRSSDAVRRWLGSNRSRTRPSQLLASNWRIEFDDGSSRLAAAVGAMIGRGRRNGQWHSHRNKFGAQRASSRSKYPVLHQNRPAAYTPLYSRTPAPTEGLVKVTATPNTKPVPPPAPSMRPNAAPRKTPPPEAPAPGPNAPRDAAPGPERVSPFSWLLLALLVAWNLWWFFPRPTAEVSLPYSEFVAQVAAGNVTQVRIVGEAISGAFAHAIDWPQSATPAGPTVVPKTGTEKQASAEQKQTPYSNFRTTFPSVVGDTSLMPLLQAHHVTIEVVTSKPPWFVILLTDGLPVLLMVALLVWMGRQQARTQRSEERRVGKEGRSR